VIAGLLAFLVGAVRALLGRPLPGGGGTGRGGAGAGETRGRAGAIAVAPGDRGGPDEDPRERFVPHDRRAETAVAVLLVLGGFLAIAFAVLVAAHPQTQLLGATLAAGLACLGAAMAIASRRLVPQVVEVEERDEVPEGVDAALTQELASGAEGISRRRLLAGAAGVAGCGLAGALVLPLTALGPNLDGAPDRSPWRRGRRLVDPEGRPLRAADIGIGSMWNALPAADPQALEDFTAPVVVVRVDPRTLDLPPDRRGWAPGGILAFSQICTHAACAVTLFRYPVDEDTSKPPGLVCPCHYSTFDVRRGAVPVFGPAARPLPQLPLAVDGQGFLVADGPLSGSVGPSYLRSEQRDDLR
jgi:quinol---cytochrome c reductase iron-sulfur subunit